MSDAAFLRKLQAKEEIRELIDNFTLYLDTLTSGEDTDWAHSNFAALHTGTSR
jgi:hypothetical protein